MQIAGRTRCVCPCPSDSTRSDPFAQAAHRERVVVIGLRQVDQGSQPGVVRGRIETEDVTDRPVLGPWKEPPASLEIDDLSVGRCQHRDREKGIGREPQSRAFGEIQQPHSAKGRSVRSRRLNASAN